MAHVQLDPTTGKVTGMFAVAQDGNRNYAEIPDDDPRISEFIVSHAQTYRDLRAAEYPPMADYLDAIVKGDRGSVDAYIAACKAVKAKYPKP